MRAIAVYNGSCPYYCRMSKWFKIPSLRKSDKDMYNDATYIGKDNGGNHIYVPEWYEALVSNGGNSIDFNMRTVEGKSKALHQCWPFAMVLDHCGRMMQNGRYYVTDANGNEKRSFRDIVDLLNRPNVLQSGRTFIKQVEIMLRCFGFCPIYTLRATRSDLPLSMTIIPPELFYMESSGNAFFAQRDLADIVKRTYIRWGNVNIELGEEEYFVIYDSIINIQSGEGNRITFYSPVDTLNQHTKNYMAQLIGRGNLIINGGPKGILYGNDTTDAGNAALTPSESKKLQDDFKRKYGIVQKLYEVMVTPKKLGWITLGANTQQLMLHEEDKACIEAIAQTVGIDPNLVIQGSTYDNSAQAKKAAYQDLIIPDSEAITEAITNAICRDRAVIKMDFTHVPCLQKDMKELAEALSTASNAVVSLYNNRLLTFEESRTELSNFTDIDPDSPDGEFKNETNNEEDGEEQMQEQAGETV